MTGTRQCSRNLHQEWPALRKELPSKLPQTAPNRVTSLLTQRGRGKQHWASLLQLPSSCQPSLTLSICCCCCCLRYCCCCWSGRIWLGRIPEGTPCGPKWFIPLIMGVCCIDWWGNLQDKRTSSQSKGFTGSQLSLHNYYTTFLTQLLTAVRQPKQAPAIHAASAERWGTQGPLMGLIQPVFLEALSNTHHPTVLHGFPAELMPAQEQWKSQMQPFNGDLLVRF